MMTMLDSISIIASQAPIAGDTKQDSRGILKKTLIAGQLLVFFKVALVTVNTSWSVHASQYLMVEHDWIYMEVRFSRNATTKHGVKLQRIRKKKKWAINEKKFPGLYSVISTFDVANGKVNSLDTFKKS